MGALLGWEYTSSEMDANHPHLKAGDRLAFDIWWEYLGLPPQDGVFAWLVGPDNKPWLSAGVQAKAQAGNPADWQTGTIVPAEGVFTIPVGMPPGDYTLYLGVYPETADRADHFLFFNMDDTPRTITIEPGGSSITTSHNILPRLLPAPLHPGQTQAAPLPLDASFGALHLLGWQSDQAGLAIDQPFTLNLFWQAARDIEQRYQGQFVLLDGGGQPRFAWEPADLVAFYPTQQWQTNESVRSQHTITPDARTPGGDFTLALRMYANNQPLETVPILPVSISGRSRQFEMATTISPLATEFEQGIQLLGYQLNTATAYPGDTLSVQLAWQPTAPLMEDYTVFVQLLGPDGQVYGQMDAIPLNGSAPTSQWTPGEIIEDTYTFPIAAEAPVGTHKLVTGLYRFETGERLTLSGSSEDLAVLSEVIVQ